MSIFGSIVNKIFGHASAAPGATPPAAGTPGAPSTPPPSPGGDTTTGFNNPPATQGAPGSTNQTASSQQPTNTAGSQPAGTPANVDVAAILDGLAAKNTQKLDWRHSIVDMMKLLGLDSGLHARQELAKELHYSGSTDDSAAMNIWLHKQVMQKLAENGGKVPDDLK